MVYYVKTLTPCVMNPVIAWHVAHGFVYDAVDEERTPLGVVYLTCLCGDGFVMHFDVCRKPSVRQMIDGFTKAARFFGNAASVLYLFIPEKSRLCSIFRRLGFADVDHFERDGEMINVLKYIAG